MASTTRNEIPARETTTIQQGSPWFGIKVRFLDEDGDPVPGDLSYNAQVRTDTIPNGGVLLCQCDISEPDADDYTTISLTGSKTADFPVGEVFIEIDASIPGTSGPSSIARLTALVEGEITVQE